MRRAMMIGLAALVMAATSLAQVVREMPRRPSLADRVKPLQGEQKLRYLVKQLDLSAEDREYADGLIEVYVQAVQTQTTDQTARGDLVERVRALYAEMQEAEKTGDKERAQRVRDQMKALGPGVNAEREFFDSFRAILSEEQSAALDQAMARLKNAPDGALRPIDVLRVARAQKLTAEQQRKLSLVLREFRDDMKQPAGRPSHDAHAGLLNKLVENIRGILTSEQAVQFDERVNRLRPEPPQADTAREPDQAESDQETGDQPTP